jgi:hypothetical protein
MIPQRGPYALVMAPIKGAPIGVPPWRTAMYSEITRPCRDDGVVD